MYENRNGYRAPTTFTWSLGPSFRAGRISITPRLDGQYQTLGRWSGVVDEGSGFEDGGARLQISVPCRGSRLARGLSPALVARLRRADVPAEDDMVIVGDANLLRNVHAFLPYHRPR